MNPFPSAVSHFLVLVVLMGTAFALLAYAAIKLGTGGRDE